jgi:hypothetical protein
LTDRALFYGWVGGFGGFVLFVIAWAVKLS